MANRSPGCAAGASTAVDAVRSVAISEARAGCVFAPKEGGDCAVNPDRLGRRMFE